MVCVYNRRVIGVSAIPLLLAAATLIDGFLNPGSSGRSWLVPALLCVVALPGVLAFMTRGLSARVLASRLVAVPALLAPLSVAFPWTVTPSHFGVEFGGFGFFVEWLTKYPTLGPINVEVLLGLLGILGCAFLPWLSAALVLSHRSSRITRAVLLGLVLIPYLPVLIRLDVVLFTMGVLFKGPAFVPDPPIWVAFGPLLRLTGILSMALMMFKLDPDPATTRPEVTP